MSRPVLVLFRRRVVLEDAAALVRAMSEDGRYEPLVVYPLPALAAELQEAAGVPLGFVDYAGRSVKPQRAAASGERPERGSSTGLRRSLFLRFLIALARLARSRFRMARLFDTHPPAAVVVFEDRAPHPEMVFLMQARRRGVRALLVSFAASSVESDAVSRRERTEHLVDRAPWAGLKGWLARRYPEQVRDTAWGRMLFFSLPETLALACHGMLDGRNWHYGGGAIDVCAKLSRDDLEHARAEGAPAGKFVVTGQPLMDAMYRARGRAVEIRAGLAQKYALRPDRPLVVCAVPHAGEHALVGWQRHMELTAALFRALGASGANVLLSLHPRSRSQTYEGLARDTGCQLLQERLSNVLPAADVFVASYSSTVRWALLMGIPTIMADLLELDYRQFAGLPGSIVAREAAGVELALRRLVDDPRERERMGREAAAGAAGREEFDGEACKRIIEALHKD